MKVLGIYSSPREGGNSDLLLDRVLAGAKSAGAEVETMHARLLDMEGCRECGGCDKTGKCVVEDDMQSVYPKLLGADAIILATPIFFYGAPSQVKRLVDRCQAMWNKRMLEKNSEARKRYDGGKGYLIAVGATRGENLFEPVKLMAKYFFDALDKSFENGIYFRGIDSKGGISSHADALGQAYEFGKNIAAGGM